MPAPISKGKSILAAIALVVMVSNISLLGKLFHLVPSGLGLAISIVEFFGIPFIFYVLFRLVMVQSSQYFMNRKTKENNEEINNTPLERKPNSNTIEFKEHLETEPIDLNKEHGRLFLHSLFLGTVSWQIFIGSIKKFGIGLAACYLGTGIILGYWPSSVIVSTSIITGLLFWAIKSRFTSKKRVNLSSIVIFYSIWLFLFLSFSEGGSQYHFIKHGLVYVLCTCTILIVVIGQFLKLRNNAITSGNKQLLILRVFGSDSNTAFLFREISRTWKFLGSFITIADPSYIRYHYSVSSRENRSKIVYLLFFFIFINAFFFFIFFLLVRFGDIPIGIAYIAANVGILNLWVIASMLVWAFFIPLILMALFIVTWDEFTSSQKKLNKQIDKIKHSKPNYGGLYKDYTLYCYDTIWKKAVSQLLPVSDAVLMDLRGYSPERKGCEYELQLLLNNYPLSKIVFIADKNPNFEILKEMLRESWENLNTDSPNLENNDQALKIYFPETEDSKDIYRIVGLLTTCIDTTNLVNENSLKDDPIYKSLPSKAIGMGQSIFTLEDNKLVIKNSTMAESTKNAGANKLERIDMAVAKPLVARLVIPLFIALLLLNLFLKIWPMKTTYNLFKDPVILNSELDLTKNISFDKADLPQIKSKMLKKEETIDNIGRTVNELSWEIKVKGGAPGKAYSYENLNIDSTFIFKGKKYEIKTFVEKPEIISGANYKSLYQNAVSASEELALIFKTQLNSTLSSIPKLKGHLDLNYLPSNQKRVIKNLHTLFNKPVLYKLAIPDTNKILNIYLLKTHDNPNQICIIIPRALKETKLFFINAHGIIAPYTSEKSKNVNESRDGTSTGYMQYFYNLSDLKAARLEIITQKFKVINWPFEIQDPSW